MNSKLYKVLIVDDSEADRFFFRHAIHSAAQQLHVVGEFDNGAGAIDYLAGAGDYADRARHPFPDLLVLDSRMPGKNGIEVLEWLRTRDFAGLKVAFFADSSVTSLKTRALALGATYYFTKSVHSDDLLRAVSSLQTELERHAGHTVLLRHRQTRAYYQGPCQWTPFSPEALEFDTFEKAAFHAHDENLTHDVEVMLLFKETGQTFSFPFPKAGRVENP